MFRVMVKFKPLAIVIYKSAAAVQKIMGVSADAIFRSQCFGTELSVLLGLVQFRDSLFPILKAGTMLAQLMLDLGL